MKRVTEKIVLLALLVAVGGLIYTAWQWRDASRSESCRVCRRHLHAGSQVVALQQGRKEAFCCPTCAVTLGSQAGQAVTVVELTDFETGSRIAPDAAYVVQGSDINLCLQHPMLTDSQKQPASQCASTGARRVCWHSPAGRRLKPFGRSTAAGCSPSARCH